MDFDLLNKADAALEINNDEAVIIVAGPTGSGKSALAIEWANRHRGVIINADSMQLYHDLRLLTARPSLAEEAMAPHALYGTVPYDKTCSACNLSVYLPHLMLFMIQIKCVLFVSVTRMGEFFPLWIKFKSICYFYG